MMNAIPARRLMLRNNCQLDFLAVATAWDAREGGLNSTPTNRYRLFDTSGNFVPSFRTSRGVTPKRRLNERLK
jgi:hypothetical protein